jgi:hypothetical protein
MKKTIYLFLLLQIVCYGQAQDRDLSTATVNEVSSVPIFFYSDPIKDYKVVGKAQTTIGILKTSLDEKSTLSEKAIDLVKTANSRKEKGKIPAFDAILVDVDAEKILAIQFKGEKSLKANPQLVKGVPVYFFSKPDGEYESIKKLPAEFSALASNGMIMDKVNNVVKKALKMEEKGEAGKFDAIIFNPDDITSTLIKFK